jgi:Mrp family chromosome partitioning ATPase
MLQIPLFLSIPRLKTKNLNKLMPGGSPNGETSLVVNGSSQNDISVGGNILRPFHETLRDRLISYFESKNLTHKPKLVGLTGLGIDAGVTTTAAGLARSLSETGEGNVLLVDMTIGHGAAQQFTRGKEACGLDQLLEARDQAHVHENLYVVTENSSSERLSRNLPQRFTKLIPKLKASDFDYIIFDMPTVDQLSITPRLAGFMDMVLLIVESEKTDRDMVQGACALLAESKAHVGVVLNKTKNYVPARLHQQLMGS